MSQRFNARMFNSIEGTAWSSHRADLRCGSCGSALGEVIETDRGILFDLTVPRSWPGTDDVFPQLPDGVRRLVNELLGDESRKQQLADAKAEGHVPPKTSNHRVWLTSDVIRYDRLWCPRCGVLGGIDVAAITKAIAASTKKGKPVDLRVT